MMLTNMPLLPRRGKAGSLAGYYRWLASLPIADSAHPAHGGVSFMRRTSMSNVTEIPCADPHIVQQRYAERLSFETDCWDVHDAMKNGKQDFVLLDVRG